MVREVLYACQAVNGKYIALPSDEDGAVHISAALKVRRPERQLMMKLSELGWLFRCTQTRLPPWKLVGKTIFQRSVAVSALGCQSVWDIRAVHKAKIDVLLSKSKTLLYTKQKEDALLSIQNPEATLCLALKLC